VRISGRDPHLGSTSAEVGRSERLFALSTSSAVPAVGVAGIVTTGDGTSFDDAYLVSQAQRGFLDAFEGNPRVRVQVRGGAR